MSKLSVLAEGLQMGVVFRDGEDLSFRYSDEWLEKDDIYPLSLSMPLSPKKYADKLVRPLLWNFLPDSDDIIKGWSEQFQVSARSPFSLLRCAGEDCAGAVQFVRPERVETVLSGSEDAIEWLTEGDIEKRLAALRKDAAKTRAPTDVGQFSLAGAQPKTALHLSGEGRWGIPSGRIATTHILKPSTLGFKNFEENEHFCLLLAAQLGMASAYSMVKSFGAERTIVVERFDRIRDDAGALSRVHQEDFCQALGSMPERKYQAEGGPSMVDLMRIVREHCVAPAEDAAELLDAFVFNWLVGGTDAHAKNFSIVHEVGVGPSLSPLYDLATTLPYPDDVDQRRAKLSMKVGGKYRIQEIGRHQWEKAGRELGFEKDYVLDRISSMLSRMPAAASGALEECRSQGLKARMLSAIASQIKARCVGLKKQF